VHACRAATPRLGRALWTRGAGLSACARLRRPSHAATTSQRPSSGSRCGQGCCGGQGKGLGTTTPVLPGCAGAVGLQPAAACCMLQAQCSLRGATASAPSLLLLPQTPHAAHPADIAATAAAPHLHSQCRACKQAMLACLRKCDQGLSCRCAA